MLESMRCLARPAVQGCRGPGSDTECWICKNHSSSIPPQLDIDRLGAPAPGRGGSPPRVDGQEKGEKEFIDDFARDSRFVTAATHTGPWVHRGVFFQKENLQEEKLSDRVHYVDTGASEVRIGGVLYTDKISCCCGLALWSQEKAGLMHIVPGTEIEKIVAFLEQFANGSAELPEEVFLATWEEHSPWGGIKNETTETSLYAAACALVNHYGDAVRTVTTIITGFRGRRWSHEAQLSVAAQHGISIAIPGRGNEDFNLNLREAENALIIGETTLGKEHSDLALGHNDLALFYYKHADYGQAEWHLRDALKIAETALGKEHPNVATCLCNLGAVCNKLNKYDEGILYFGRALGIFEKALGKHHPKVATCLTHYARLLRKINRVPEAEKLESRAEAIRPKSA